MTVRSKEAAKFSNLEAAKAEACGNHDQRKVMETTCATARVSSENLPIILVPASAEDAAEACVRMNKPERRNDRKDFTCPRHVEATATPQHSKSTAWFDDLFWWHPSHENALVGPGGSQKSSTIRQSSKRTTPPNLKSKAKVASTGSDASPLLLRICTFLAFRASLYLPALHAACMA